jgi:hypothetical protein
MLRPRSVRRTPRGWTRSADTCHREKKCRLHRTSGLSVLLCSCAAVTAGATLASQRKADKHDCESVGAVSSNILPRSVGRTSMTSHWVWPRRRQALHYHRYRARSQPPTGGAPWWQRAAQSPHQWRPRSVKDRHAQHSIEVLLHKELVLHALHGSYCLKLSLLPSSLPSLPPTPNF